MRMIDDITDSFILAFLRLNKVRELNFSTSTNRAIEEAKIEEVLKVKDNEFGIYHKDGIDYRIVYLNGVICEKTFYCAKTVASELMHLTFAQEFFDV